MPFAENKNSKRTTKCMKRSLENWDEKKTGAKGEQQDYKGIKELEHK